jgi:hypothetical protein
MPMCRMGWVKAVLLLVCLSISGGLVYADGGAEYPVAASAAGSFEWAEDRKLSWDDFAGSYRPEHGDMAAAGTCCSIGFNAYLSPRGHIEVDIFNTFNPSSSWVLHDQRNPALLAHEQGHFDICELYTRKLRERVSKLVVAASNFSEVYKRVYAELYKEYDAAQQRYEEETMHGLIEKKQLAWQMKIANDLRVQEAYALGK